MLLSHQDNLLLSNTWQQQHTVWTEYWDLYGNGKMVKSPRLSKQICVLSVCSNSVLNSTYYTRAADNFIIREIFHATAVPVIISSGDMVYSSVKFQRVCEFVGCTESRQLHLPKK